MEFYPFYFKDFLSKASQILQTQGELLLLIRYPAQAGNRDFFIIQSYEAFLKFLKERSLHDSIYIFKSFDKVAAGLVTESFIAKTMDEIKLPTQGNWLVIFTVINSIDRHWFFVDNKEELRITLQKWMGEQVRILEEPDWHNEEMAYHTYIGGPGKAY